MCRVLFFSLDAVEGFKREFSLRDTSWVPPSVSYKPNTDLPKPACSIPMLFMNAYPWVHFLYPYYLSWLVQGLCALPYLSYRSPCPTAYRQFTYHSFMVGSPQFYSWMYASSSILLPRLTEVICQWSSAYLSRAYSRKFQRSPSVGRALVQCIHTDLKDCLI